MTVFADTAIVRIYEIVWVRRWKEMGYMNNESDLRSHGVLPSVLGAIGKTPLVRLDRLTAHSGCEGTILAKLDHLNPGFSKKDRAALGVIEQAEADGTLKPGQCVVELTSGNMGTGLAIVCGIKGYPFVAVMSKGNSEERARMMRALGAQVVLVDQLPTSKPGQVSGDDLHLVDLKAKEIASEKNAFRADQFAREGNPLAHYYTTGQEIWSQTNGEIDGFVDFLGSGGTFAGVTRFLKEKNRSIKCFALEPEGAAALAGESVVSPDHPIQGGGYAMKDLKFLRDISPDGYLTVSGDIARRTALDLAKYEGIFGGFSAGANVAGALSLLHGEMRGKTIAAVICDSGLKYLSTDLWTE